MWVIGRVGEARVAGPGAARDGGRVWAAGWGIGREGWGRGQRWGGGGWVRVCCVGVRVCLQQGARVVSCRPGGLQEKLAVLCGRGKDFADDCVYLVHLLVEWWEEVTVGVG